MNDAARVLLENAEARLLLDPRRGGAVREFSWRGRQVLRPATDDHSLDPFQLSCFPLVPYVNRIAGCTFRSGNKVVRLAPNWNADPHPLHGQGWRAPWDVTASTSSAATLEFMGGGNDWPWLYRARQRFELRADGLLIRLSVQNLSQEPMPVALGLHPYFPGQGQASMTAQAGRVWLTDVAALPVTEAPVPADWSFATGRKLAGVPLDHCFTQWDGQALLRWPGYRVRYRATGCRFLHVYVPRGQDFFCVEPQTAATGAFNGPDGPPDRLPPQGALSMTLDLAVELGNGGGLNVPGD